ncbi:unnamed protein product, partial [Amoebophrya sp. A120]|eukprot:GSA120T00018679001.1
MNHRYLQNITMLAPVSVCSLRFCRFAAALLFFTTVVHDQFSGTCAEAGPAVEGTTSSSSFYQLPVLLTCEDPNIFGSDFAAWRKLVREKMEVIFLYQKENPTNYNNDGLRPNALDRRMKEEGVAKLFRDQEVVELAEHIVFKYQHVMFSVTDEGQVQMNANLDYVRALGKLCVDPTFDKYLVQHYFRNREIPYEEDTRSSGGTTEGNIKPKKRQQDLRYVKLAKKFYDLNSAVLAGGKASDKQGSSRTTSPSSSGPPENKELFCVLGYATAALILAVNAESRQLDVGHARVYLQMTQYLMGDYLPFAWFPESGWPLSTYLILKNLAGRTVAGESWFYDKLLPNITAINLQVEEAAAALRGPNREKNKDEKTKSGITTKVEANKGVVDESFFRYRSSDTPAVNTMSLVPKTGKQQVEEKIDPINNPTMERAWSYYTNKLQHKKWDQYFLDTKSSAFDTIHTVWQLCFHTATAGEMYNFVNRFVRRIPFYGNSLATDFCRNYNLCPPNGEQFGSRLFD